MSLLPFYCLANVHTPTHTTHLLANLPLTAHHFSTTSSLYQYHRTWTKRKSSKKATATTRRPRRKSSISKKKKTKTRTSAASAPASSAASATAATRNAASPKPKRSWQKSPARRRKPNGRKSMPKSGGLWCEFRRTPNRAWCCGLKCRPVVLRNCRCPPQSGAA